MGAEDDDIPLTQLTGNPPTPEASSTDLGGSDYSSLGQSRNITLPSPTRDPSQVRITSGPPSSEHPSTSQTVPRQDPLPPTRPQKWATFINIHLDTLTYTLLFLLVGLPIYYSTSYTMPAHLTLSILTYFLALSLPPNYKRILHPVLVSCKASPAHCFLVQAGREHRDNVPVFPCSPKKDNADLEKYNSLPHHPPNLAPRPLQTLHPPLRPGNLQHQNALPAALQPQSPSTPAPTRRRRHLQLRPRCLHCRSRPPNVPYVLFELTSSYLITNFGPPPPLYAHMRGSAPSSAPTLAPQNKPIKQNAPSYPSARSINPPFRS